MATRLDNPELQALLSELMSERLVFFPIRHHSPACAWHLERLIRERSPEVILIEGPTAFTPLIPLILHAKTKAPFAVYTSFVNTLKESDQQDPRPLRRAAYYPFCDYSPELVALRIGHEVGATLRFIDLDFADQVIAEQEQPAQEAPRVESLLAERHLKRSRFLQKLAERAGCRDHNDLWDHLFETRLTSNSGGNATKKFIQDVASWCFFARTDATDQELEADGTRAREEAMASAIREEYSQGRRILVVTGGFHTVALLQLVAAKDLGTKPLPVGPKPDTLACLVRYSFDQLDALNGYAAGMPSPFYYDQIWQAAKSKSSDPAFCEVAAKILVELGQLTRRKKLATALSPADEIAALDQARRLAQLRGHPGPTREDLLDGIRSCFVKGAMDAEGEVVLGLARAALSGTSIGEVPPEAGVPPIVENFRNIAKKLRLNINDSVRHKSSFDLYRKRVHREASRFFHSLAFLEVPFATLEGGPDFVKGTSLDRLHEHWSYQWVPQTESHLVEASVFGATVEEAAAGRLIKAISDLENQGRGRSATEAVTMLVHGCRMGLQSHTTRLLQLIADLAGQDPSIESLSEALNQLVLLWESREPLEAHRLPEIPPLIACAYQRACYLLNDTSGTPPEAAGPKLQSMLIIRDVLRTSATGIDLLDSSLFWDALSNMAVQSQCPALLVGGASGLLYGEGRLGEAELLKLLSGHLNAASAKTGDHTEFLIGLLQTCRELAWQQPALVKAVEELLSTWSEEEFIDRIPHLRMAFADLTPRETDQVAAVVAQLHEGTKLPPLPCSEMTESEMMATLRLNLAVRNALKEDGLEDWISSPSFSAREVGS